MINDFKIIAEAIKLVEEGISVTFPVKGQSMLPFIIGGEESVILVPPESLQVGDVALAWVDGCRYVVHRIIRLENGFVTLMGDGNVYGTEHCLLNDVKAKITHVVDKQGKRRYLYTWQRRTAAKLWRWLIPIRRFLLVIYK